MESTRDEETVKPGARAPAIDTVVALANVGGDRQLLHEVIELFLQDQPRMLADLEEAVHERRAVDLHRCAHALKGSVAVFGAAGARSLACELESMGRDGTTDGAAELLPVLRQELGRIARDLRAVVRSAGA